MARLIISVEAVGLRALAGPVTAAAVLYDATATEPVFGVRNKQGAIVKYSLQEPKKIPAHLLPGIATHIRRTALCCVHVHRPARAIATAREASWFAMGQAAARVAERAVHQDLSTCQVGTDALELHIPPGGFCPYALVGRVGQRVVLTDWRRGAAFVLARAAHYDALLLLHERYPRYDFDVNRGNTSQTHLKAIRRYGRTPEHRSPA